MRKSELRSFIWRAEADALLTGREACFGLRRRFIRWPMVRHKAVQAYLAVKPSGGATLFLASSLEPRHRARGYSR
eukprot:4560528-Prymnesium_polylepis.1